MATISTPSQSVASATGNKLDNYTRCGLWALPVWVALLVYGTLSHQPDYTTNFPAYAKYVTTTDFLISHVVASILGAGIGILGLTALFLLLCKGRTPSLALWALVMGIKGSPSPAR